MNNPLLNRLTFCLMYIGIWVVIIIAQILMVFYYFEIPNKQTESLHIIDSIICNTLQAVCILGLWYPIKYYKNLKNIPHFLFFHFTLFLISGIIWIGLGYYFTKFVFFSNSELYHTFFMTILPIRIAFGLLIYIVFILIYYLLQICNDYKLQKRSVEEKITEIATVPVEKLTRIIVKKNSEYHCINVNQIRYIEANGDYVLIYTDTNRYLKDQTMKYWELHLPDDYFVRIHRSFIVNIEVIAKIELYEKELYKVHLKNGDVLKASSSGYKLLKQKMRL